MTRFVRIMASRLGRCFSPDLELIVLQTSTDAFDCGTAKKCTGLEAITKLQQPRS